MVPHLHWHSTPVTVDDARLVLSDILAIAQTDLPFGARVAQLALAAQSLNELEGYLSSLYRIALEDGHWSLPDLIDAVLRWVEDADEAAAQLPWDVASR